MRPSRRRLAVTFLLAGSLAPGLARAAPRNSDAPAIAGSPSTPDTFGVADYTVTALSDLAFNPFDGSFSYATHSPEYFRYVTTGAGGSFVTGADIPAGAVIDWVGLGDCDVVGFSFQLNVYEVTDTGFLNGIALINSAAHAGGTPCGTDYNPTAIGYQITGNAHKTIQIEVHQQSFAPVDGSARFSGVEIWWHRTVSPAPATATFNDVPTGHPFFQYIEALAASGITGGCGNGNYCPDAPLTRGQMAVFLSKALGLHFPGNPPI